MSAPEADAVALTGIGLRFPGADTVAAFWSNLVDGVESIRHLKLEELVAGGIDESTLANPRYVPAKGVLEGADMFDAAFFGCSPREAQLMDPQHRLMLECAWTALEDGGCNPQMFPGRIGVFASVGESTYLLFNLLRSEEVLRTVDGFQLRMLTERDFATTRISHKFDLRGPAVTVSTGCSSSLVAIHYACQSLLAGECDAALAGGASVTVPLTAGYLFERGGIHSPDGHCRPFDAEARGTVAGDGAALVLLRRLSDAERDGDRIYATVIGSAINNDGSRKVGFTAPSIPGQVEVIREAIAVAGIEPDSIAYVEAHGTATALGDPIEVAALTEAHRGRRTRCVIGSVKGNLGHLDPAAGVAGFIKAALSVDRGLIPPTLNFLVGNPECNFDESPFFATSEVVPWPSNAQDPPRAAVSSFGIGGTNAHLIVEQAPPRRPRRPNDDWMLLPLSARTPSALHAARHALAAHLERNSEECVEDIAFTLATGRAEFSERLAIACISAADASVKLRAEPFAAPAGRCEMRDRPVVFLFPGQGAQQVGMAAQLYKESARAREIIDEGADRLRAVTGFDLRELLLADKSSDNERKARLDETVVTQPAMFLVEYAIATELLWLGLEPAAMAGHSLGEYTAACIAGVWSFEAALDLVAARASLMQETEPGAMTAFEASHDDAIALAEARTVDIAAMNSANNVVCSGRASNIALLEADLQERGIAFRRLPVRRAFHSSLMDPIQAEFAIELGKAEALEPSRQVISSVHGKRLTSEALKDEYWLRQLRRPVRFYDCLQSILEAYKNPIFVEVGPGRTLIGLARKVVGQDHSPGGAVYVPTLANREDGAAEVAEAIGRAWVAGARVRRVEWSDQVRKAALPTIQFERQRFWVDALPSPPKEPASSPLLLEPAVAEMENSEDGAAALWSIGTVKIVADLWRMLLGIDTVDPDSNFFDAGGDSLLATKLVARLGDELDIELPVGIVFKFPALQALASAIDELIAESEADDEVPS